MELRQQVADVQINGAATQQSEDFKIVITDGKVFDMLSSTIYSNKIRAIIRELSCNAIDAHRDAGISNEPFTLQIPTRFDPMFMCRDYGKGLSREQMFKLYTSYFTSTKTNSNDDIGGFGLGSKSPFAYTDAFQVRSFQNGVCSAYTCYKKNGMPKIDLIVETKTTERDGLEVSFPVSENDFNRFNREAAFVISSFSVKPDHNIYSDYDAERYAYRLGDKMGGMYTIRTAAVNALFAVLMGGVLYPVVDEGAEIFMNSDLYSLLKTANSDSNTVYVYEAKIGEFDLPPSRELIDNTEYNLNRLRDIVAESFKVNFKFIDTIYQQIKDMHIKDALLALSDILDHMEENNLLQSFSRNAVFRYFEYAKGFEFRVLDAAKFPDVNTTIRIGGSNRQAELALNIVLQKMREDAKTAYNVGKTGTGILPTPPKFKIKMQQFNSKKLDECAIMGDRFPTSFITDPFTSLSELKAAKPIVIVKLQKGFTKLLKEFDRDLSNYKHKNAAGSRLFFFDADNESHLKSIEFFKLVLGDDMVKLVTFDDILPAGYASSPAVARNPRGEKQYEFNWLDIDFDSYSSKDSMCINDIEEIEDTTYYIESGEYYGDDYRKFQLLRQNGVMDKLSDKYEIKKIMRVPSGLLKAVQRNENFVHIATFVDEVMDDVFHSQAVFSHESSLEKLISRIPTTKMKKQLLFIKQGNYSTGNTLIHNSELFIQKFGKQAYDAKIDYIRDTMLQQKRRIEQALKKYPLINTIMYSYSIDNESVVEYIEAMDLYLSTKQTNKGI